MKGLLLKDILSLRQQVKIYGLLLGLWLVIAVFNHDAAFFSGMAVMFVMMIPVAAMAYDEKAKWDKYALTMPVTRAEIVLSKYLLTLLVALAGLLCSLIFGLAVDLSFRESLTEALMVVSAGLLLTAVMLPLIFHLGVEKGRVALFIVLLVPTLLIVLLSRIGRLPSPGEALVQTLLWSLPLAAAGLFAASYAAALALYRRREW